MKAIPFVVVGIIILLGGFMVFLNKPQTEPAPKMEQTTSTIAPFTTNQPVDIKASFTIITGNITRSFTNSKYHNQSADVYIEASDPIMVHVKKSGITWGDFFKTLPMKLTKDCLITGDGETFCDQKDGSLNFYLNDTKTPNLLEKQIKEGDKALIRFSQ